jgi:hypothetical protein
MDSSGNSSRSFVFVDARKGAQIAPKGVAGTLIMDERVLRGIGQRDERNQCCHLAQSASPFMAQSVDHQNPLLQGNSLTPKGCVEVRKGLEGRGHRRWPSAAQAAEPPQSPVFGAAENAPKCSLLSANSIPP